MASGPLSGVRVLEFAGIGPGPFCGMLLSDMGADVLRVDRKVAGGSKGSDPASAGRRFNVTSRGRRSVALDLKSSAGREACLDLAGRAEVLIEGFRPGVMERLGLGPEECFGRNKGLVYGRMTGWGQTGPLSEAAGHDINYIALTGALHAIGPKEGRPTAPLNLVGDFGGGALYLAMGVLAGLLESRKSGEGQVVDCAMTEGSALLAAGFYGMTASGMWDAGKRESNLLDGGAPYYGTYETKDGKYVSIGSLEPQFYALLREKAGLSGELFERQGDKARWEEQRAAVAEVFRGKTRDEWTKLMEGTDVCFAPVLDFVEAPKHAHNLARESFVEVEGVMQPNAAPRFSRTAGGVQGGAPERGEGGREAMRGWGVGEEELAALEESGSAMFAD